MPASVLLVRLLARGPQTLHRSFDRRPARRALGDFGFRGFFGHPLEMLFVQRCEERSLGLGGEVFVGIDLQQHDPVWILHQEEQIIRPPAPEVQVHYAERVEQRIVVPVDPGPVEAVGKGARPALIRATISFTSSSRAPLGVTRRVWSLKFGEWSTRLGVGSIRVLCSRRDSGRTGG